MFQVISHLKKRGPWGVHDGCRSWRLFQFHPEPLSLFFIELLPFLFWPFLLFYFCVNCFLFVSPSTCTDEEWNEPSAPPFSFLHSLSFTVPFPILRFAHLQPPVTMSKVFSPFPETSEKWTEVEILSLSQTHTAQSLKERNNFLYYRGDNWHFWEKQQVFSYSLTVWRKLWPEHTVFD